MAFRFRYESLLSYRRYLKDRSEIDLARAYDQLREARDVLSFIEGKYREINVALQSHLSRAVSSQLLKAYRDYLDDLRRKRGENAILVSKREETVKEKRDELLRKSMDCKIIEKLKDKDIHAWRGEQNRLESKRLSEVAILRHRKKSS
jgi:flagellar FliJ protein